MCTVFLKTMGCQASRYLTHGIVHGLSTEIVAFKICSGYSKVLR